MRARSALTVIVIALVVSAALPGHARAGVWTYDTCSQPGGAPASTVGWTTGAFVADGEGGDSNSCAYGNGSLLAVQNGLVPDGDGPQWQFTAPGGDTIAGGVIDATLAVPQGEDWLSSPGDSNTGADDFGYCAFNEPDNGGICDTARAWTISHTGGTSIYMVARCVDGGECPNRTTPSASVTMTSAQIELSDDSLPTGSGFTGPLLDRTAHKIADLLFTAADPRAPGAAPGYGPGVYSVTVLIDGHAVFSGTPNVNGGACSPIPGGPAGGGLMFDSEQPCPTATSVDVPVNTAALADGGHDLQVTVTDAAGNVATVLDREIDSSNPTRTPAPRHGEVGARFSIGWRWLDLRTRLHTIHATSLPRRGEVTITCRGRHCPRLRLRREPTRRAGRLWAELHHTTFRAGQRLLLTVSAPHRRPEPIQFTFRDGRKPTARLLGPTVRRRRR